MRPTEVLDHQGALLDYLGAAAYKQYLDRFVESMVKNGKVSLRGGFDMAGFVRRSLQVADAYHVQSEMMPVVKAATLDLDDVDYLVHERVPSEHGFLILDEPWVTPDVWGVQMTTHAIQWMHGAAQVGSSTAPGLWVVQYSHLDDERDEVTRGLIAQDGYEELSKVGKLHVNHIWFLAYGERVGPMEEVTPEDYARFMLPGQTLQATTFNHARLVTALFRLLNQSFVEVRDAPLDRSASRRAQRKNLPQRVQTIKLRRKETRYLHPGEGGTVDWQHQWFVRGKFQWRACGPDHPLAEPYEGNATGYHANVYIRGHWKGPDDKPVLITEKVFDLAR